METGTKVLIGVVAAAGIGAAIYFGFIRNTDEIVKKPAEDAQPNGGGSSGTGSGGTTPSGGRPNTSAQSNPSTGGGVRGGITTAIKAPIKTPSQPPRTLSRSADGWSS